MPLSESCLPNPALPMALLDLPLTYREIDQSGDFDRTFSGNPGGPWKKFQKPREKSKEYQRNQRNIQLPSGNDCYVLLWKITIAKGDFPMKNGRSFHSCVSLPEG